MNAITILSAAMCKLTSKKICQNKSGYHPRAGKRKLFILLLPVILFTACNREEELPGILYTDASLPVEERVEDLLGRMRLDQKIGQMILIERNNLSKDEDITIFNLGAIFSGGGSAPMENSPEGWADMLDHYQSLALNNELGIPLLYGTDAVHGHNNVKEAVIFPHNIGLGCTRNPSLVEQAARITALEVKGTGVNWTFGPCVAVPRDERWGRTYEGFGETPELTAQMAAAVVKGLQGMGSGDSVSIMACAKHYLGDGGTSSGYNNGDMTIDLSMLREIHLPGYVSAIEENIGSIMLSGHTWNGQIVSEDAFLVEDILQDELGFDGLLLATAGSATTVFNQGANMYMTNYPYAAFLYNMIDLVDRDVIKVEKIDESVRKILRIKFELGLFEDPYANRDLTSSIGSEAHRQVARQCVRESMVLLSNEDKLLPLSKHLSGIHVAGIKADDLGAQCGGWTISSQGSLGPITTGTSILEAIMESVDDSSRVSYTASGLDAEGADVGIVVIGERPYAMGDGYRTDLSLEEEEVQAVINVKNSGIPVVVVLLSGRPLILNPILDHCDAIIAAWLPGTEGLGVTDILFGDYQPTGKLSHSWPASMSQIPINHGDPDYAPLFPYGYGLEYD